jgi:predicted nucleic acid-binding protein
MTVTAVDSNILIDVLFDDTEFSSTSTAALALASEHGGLVISTVVMAEVAACFPNSEAALNFFRSIDLLVTPFDAQGAFAAGHLWGMRTHKDRSRILPDYIVASHGVHHANRLLTRDSGFKRMNVPGLVVVTPAEVLEGNA